MWLARLVLILAIALSSAAWIHGGNAVASGVLTDEKDIPMTDEVGNLMTP